MKHSVKTQITVYAEWYRPNNQQVFSVTAQSKNIKVPGTQQYRLYKIQKKQRIERLKISLITSC